MDEERLQRTRRESEEQATSQRAAILGVRYVDMRPLEATLELISGALSLDEMRHSRIVPLVRGGGSDAWQFGITTQTPQSFISDLAKQYGDQGRKIEFDLISGSGFRAMIERFDPVVKIVHDNIRIASDGDSQTIEKVSQTLQSVGTDEVFDYLVSQADLLGASDIHIENQREKMRIRMRVDGVLHPVAEISPDRYRSILGVLASRANISTAAKEAQSGHIQVSVGEGEAKHLLNLRVETIPTLNGQDAVIRLFNFDQSMLDLDRLGLERYEREQIEEIISHPRGMVLMVGPTGSGKSTTLYSMLNALNSTERKIITLEDPIEYGIDGITQIPVDTTSGQSFADGLRSVLRLDPDVVMVGEIRDKDTARTAVQASITGHLVMSSFHAVSASAAFSRMVDMIGVNPIFSTAIRLVIAQRLVRQLDDSSKEAYTPDESTKAWIKDALKDLPSHVAKPDLENITLYRPVISEESPFGFKGRMAIMEQMVVTEEIQKYLRGDKADVHAELIEKDARSGGMITLLESGVLAVLRGETTLEEINQVI
jgi:type IV pilus assembly protein PilB